MGGEGHEQVKRGDREDDVGIEIKPGAHPDRQGCGYVTEHEHDREEKRGEKYRPYRVVAHLDAQGIEFFVFHLFQHERLGRLYSQDAFVVSSGDLRVGLPRFAIGLKDLFPEKDAYEQEHRQQGRDDQGQLPVGDEKDDEDRGHIKRAPEDVDESPGQDGRKSAGIRSQPRHDPSGGGLVIIGEGQFLEFPEGFPAQLVFDLGLDISGHHDEAGD